MADLTQEQKFEKAFRKLIKDETAFLAEWKQEIRFMPNGKAPIIPNKKLLSIEAQHKLVDLINKLRNKRF